MARKPGTPLVGDRWSYEVRVPIRKQIFFIDVEAVSVSPNAIRDVSRTPVGGGGSPNHRPGAYLNGISPGMAVFSPYLRAFQELREGQTWSNIDVNVGSCTNNVSVSCGASAKVTGRERVTVKAGSYDAMKVVVDLNITGQGQQGGAVEYTYWFAESVARIVKVRMRVVRGLRDFPPEGDAELVTYTPAEGR